MHNKEETTLEKDTAADLFGKNMKLSASRVAKFYECGFSYFCEYGLGLKKKREQLLGALETGNFIHYILQNAMDEGLGDDESIRLTVERLASEYLLSMFDGTEPPAGFMTYFKRLVQKRSRLLIMS